MDDYIYIFCGKDFQICNINIIIFYSSGTLGFHIYMYRIPQKKLLPLQKKQNKIALCLQSFTKKFPRMLLCLPGVWNPIKNKARFGHTGWTQHLVGAVTDLPLMTSQWADFHFFHQPTLSVSGKRGKQNNSSRVYWEARACIDKLRPGGHMMPIKLFNRAHQTWRNYINSMHVLK